MYRFVVSLFLTLFLATSCDFFQKDPKPIDFKTLDQYPVFSNCDSLTTEDERRVCFEETIVQFIQRDLDTCQFISQSYLRNTGLIIHINVNKKGKCSLEEIEKLSSVEEALPELQMQINSTIENLPIITPAKKQGQNVTSKFMIPLYIEKE